MKLKKLLKALVVMDSRENSWFLNEGNRDSLECHLIDVKGIPVNMENFQGTLRMIADQTPDVLLLDSTLARNFVLSIVIQVRDKMPNLPIVLLPDIQGAAEQAVVMPEAGGNQPRLDGGTDDGLNGALVAADSIARTIRYTHGQLGLQRTLLQMALRDDLTGLHNRRGFIALATRQLRWARDTGQHMAMFFADLDGLKSINDHFGHAEGDRAISLAAACIKETFRKFDVTARLSGDEFVALISEVPGRSVEAISQRLQRNLADRPGAERPYTLSLSVGVAHFDPDKPVTLQELMRRADAALYRHKRRAHRVLDALTGANPQASARANSAIGRAFLGEPAAAISRG
ncbi:MAG TPA: GGDEF domain-containing protein [Steroidobacteraceae bacterium]|jgi:two-component system cell cycle response regulator|nr:GGDEF domain-containing protein [Steroidobacteraceae bacterium]